MRPRHCVGVTLFLLAGLAGVSTAKADFLTYSHAASALPNAPGPAITLSSITGDNDGTNYTFTLTFANPTIEGPSSGNADAVYGFINFNTDKNAATGVTGAFLASNGFEPGFGQFPPGSSGFDAYINLTSERDPFHGAPGLVDLVTTNGFNTIATVAVTYKNQVGATPSTLTFSIPVSTFTANQINLLGAGDFSVIVGNLDNATDFLPSASVPEPSAAVLGMMGASVFVLAALRRRLIAGADRPRPGRR